VAEQAVLSFGGLLRQVTRVELTGLSRSAVAALARPQGLDAGELFARTGGNPFFVTEVLADGTGRIPHTVRDAVLARVACLGTAAGELLDAAAVIPGRAELWLLERLVPATADSLDECLGSGILPCLVLPGRLDRRGQHRGQQFGRRYTAANLRCRGGAGRGADDQIGGLCHIEISFGQACDDPELPRLAGSPATTENQSNVVNYLRRERFVRLRHVSPSHCSRSPHGAGEGVSSARGLFHSG
jgi:hypothetical protein